MKKIALAFLAILFFKVSSPGQNLSKYGSDSATCVANMAFLDDYMQQEKYSQAMEPWRWLFTQCPKASVKTYEHGRVLFYKKLIDDVDDENEALISAHMDTLMKIFDEQIRYFGQEGMLLGLKGLSLYKYIPTRKEESHALLKKSIELEGVNSNSMVLHKYLQVQHDLYLEHKATMNQVIDVYDQVSELREAQSINPDSVSDHQDPTDWLFVSYLPCSKLEEEFGSQINSAPGDKELLKKNVRVLRKSGCTDSPSYVEWAEKLYHMEPGPATALSLARIYSQKGMGSKAATYYAEAVELESDNSKKASFLLESAELQVNVFQNYTLARTLALRSAVLRPGWGKPWIKIGDLYIMGSSNCPKGFCSASAYWAACDKFMKAKSVDTTCTEVANSKIAICEKKYPRRNDKCFKDVVEGAPYSVRCWINEQTTARFR